MSDLTEGYVCAACDAKPDHKCYLRNGRWLCGPCYDMERIEEFEKDIATLRASVERLTRERDEFKRIGQEFERDGRTTFEQSCINLKRAESAEATIARLAKVVRATEEVRRWASDTRIPGELPVAAVAKALSSLTAEDRRRVGIEG